jgi:hypothetical protein
MQDMRLHYTPRTAPQETETPDILVPALARLRTCRTAFDAVVLADALPELLLPALAWEASRKGMAPPAVTTALVKYCGKRFLERCLGIRRAMQLWGRHVKRESGL